MKQTIFRVRIDSGSITIVFPTVGAVYSQGTNTQIVVGAAADTVVLAANVNRQFAIVSNPTASVAFVAFGAAAAATSFQIPAGQSFTLDISTIGKNCQQAIHIFSIAGGTFPVLEFI